MVEILVYSLVNSAVFSLIAVGFALVYGVSRVANFAHGALYVVCGFLAWSFFNSLGLPYWLVVIVSLISVILIGAAIYQFLLIRVRGMPVSEIIVSLAVALVILEGLRLQRMGSFKGFIGPGYVLPVFFDRTVEIAGVTIDSHRLIIIAIALVFTLIMWLFTHYTKTGLALRAIAQNERAALMLGIDSDWTATVALSIGSALAGVAAITILPLGQITAEAGYEVLVSALVVCIVGGLGSWTGAILASFLLGFITTFVAAWGAVTYQKVVLFGVIFLVLIIKPSGLLGKQKELEERI
jgi:branched-chain amino acid transport system permease protein